MKIRHTLLMAALALAWIPAQAAQEIGVNAGAAFPTSANDFNESSKAGPQLGAYYLRALNDRLSWGAAADYYFFPDETNRMTTSLGGNIDAKAETQVLTAELLARYSILPEKNFRPYLQGGVGMNHFRQETKATPSTGASWSDTATTEERDLGSESSAGVSLSAAIGVQTALGKSWALGLEAAWHLWSVSNSEFGTDFINVPGLTLRLGKRF